MTTNIITVRQMLTEMETGVAFRIKGITYNRKRRDGGEPYEFEAMLLQAEEGKKIIINTPTRPLTRAEQGPTFTKAKPNHGVWFTRNVAICQAGERTSIIRKIQIPLVVYYNGKIVVP